MQLQLLREASVAKRFAAARSLSASVIWLAKQAIAKRHPNLTPQQTMLRFVEVHYGIELADGLRTYLQQKQQNSEYL